MRKSVLYIALTLCLAVCTSCLKYGLDPLENSDLCELVSITVEHRWAIKNANGYDQMSRQKMTLSTNKPDENNEIRFTLTVPAASKTFTEDVRANVSPDRLYMTAVISPAAHIAPLGDAPKMGYPSSVEVGKVYEYQVTAANGKQAVYRIIIEDFVK